uniref:cAMP-responsive element modulator n=1 Tax=Ficedula albicollis TaxID=59894 RepID=A0A803W2T1_FICAL
HTKIMPFPCSIMTFRTLLLQVASIADEAAQSEVIIDSQKRREILSRRPSYRKILNELSSDSPAIAKIEEEEKSEDEGTPSGISAMAMPTSLYHTNTGQYRMFEIICWLLDTVVLELLCIKMWGQGSAEMKNVDALM